MFTLLTLIFLGFGFVVLMLTFLWVGHLLARRRARKDGAEQVPEEESPAVAMMHGANYGLMLGILACLLFKVLPPLMLILTASGLFFSGRALWEGVWRYRILVYRALAGLVLSLLSVGLHYFNLTGQMPDLL